MQTELFAYKVRKIFNKWCVLFDGLVEEFTDFKEAKGFCNRLSDQGYTNADVG